MLIPQTLDMDAVRNECLDLKGHTLCSMQCETLEEVLKRVQFKNIDLEATSLDDESSVALFDMVEYYESAVHLNISGNENIGVRGWQACSRMIKKTRCLEHLEARNVTLNEQYMPILSRALRISTQLQVLKLENCNLSGRPIIILAAALKLNTGLKELYLADNDLGVTDAIQLGGLLRSNFTLQLLDISNNNIQDTGLGHISDGLTDQTPEQSGNGLSILVLWNNHLTRNASKHFARAVARSKTLETLNIGQNKLTNECLLVMKNSLQQNRTLLQLGMQSTHLSCEGAIALAECIEDNPVIQRIDLRDNSLKVAGLMALALSMKVNTSVTQLDLDDIPKKKMEDADALDQYVTLVTEIRGYCARNETAAREEEDIVEEGPTTGASGRGRLTNSTSRKISLTCETLLRTTAMPPQPIVPDSGLLAEPRRGSSGRLRSPAPSPIPSPISSPIPSPSRTRFQVSRVAESISLLNAGQSCSPSSSSSPVTPPSLSSSPSRFFPSTSTSRFRVTLVEPSAPPPTVTSPSGNITVGFNFRKSIADKAYEEIHNVPTDLQENTETAPGIAVTSSTVASQSASLMTHQAPLSQNVKVTVKLFPSSDSLVIENESNSSVASDTSEDTADMEVRTIMNACNLEGSSWVSCEGQDSVTVLGAENEVAVSSDKDVRTQFPFVDISSDKTLVNQVGADKDVYVAEQNSEGPAEQNSATHSVKSCEQFENSLGTVKLAEQVNNTSGTVKASRVADKSLCTMKREGQIDGNSFGTEKLVEHVDNSTGALKTNEKTGDSLFTMKPDEWVGDSLCAVKLVEQVNDSGTLKTNEHDDSLCVMKTDDQVDNSFGTVKLVESVDNTSGTMELDEWIDNNLSSQILDEQANNSLIPMKPNVGDDNSLSTVKSAEWMLNDLNTVTPDEQVDNSSGSLKQDEKVNCSLENMVRPLESTLKQQVQVENSMKEMPSQCTWKVLWAASVNPQPVSNSNTSVLATGPLVNTANGGSVLLSSCPQRTFELCQETVPSHTATQEVKTLVKQNPGLLRKERRISNCKNPVPDILNNNNKIKELTVIDISDENRLRLECKEESGCTRHCKDENYNVPKLRETVPEGDGTKSVSETLSSRSFEVGTTTGVNEICDSKSNFSLNSSQDGDTLEKDYTETCPESLKLAGSSDIVGNTSECTAEESDAELNIESNEAKDAPTNVVNIKPVTCWKQDSDQFGVDFGNGSASSGGLSNDRSWSRSCDSSFVSVKSVAATVCLMGSSSEFSSYEMDTQRGPGAGSLLLPDHSVEASVQPARKEMELLQNLELHPSNTI
ncbi:uncharacterized protein LOC111863928 isoform X3 [Cryptotermes secundus]|uniref:uncharacterized protein LOC111863928 isoform X3 n=1 Tax=Cryptotermes secundus TaxID=105785 RepID=UPI001454E350|nr:uncharacterized protein LOC111863928 isoform X3 [Cryptotermes secundus]